MLNKLTLEEHNLLQELHSGGIPINVRPLKPESLISPAITLRQTGTRFDNAVHLPLGYGECCCELNVAISNQTNRNIRLEAFRLEIAWVWNFRWLEKPRGNVSRQFVYSHAAYGSGGGCTLLRKPELVLNHRFARGLKIFPGETVEGTLIGAAEAGIPEDCPNVSAELVVFDARGHDYHLPAVLAVLRKKKPKGLDRPKSVHSLENPGRLEKWFEEVHQKWLKEEKAERAASEIAKAEVEDERQAETVTV
jgi:hypothetical protein